MPLTAEQAARTFRQRALLARAEREERAARTRREVEAELQGLVPAGGRAWLIGSLVWGGFGERSDVDLVLQGVSEADAVRIEDAVARTAAVSVDLLYLDELPSAFQQRIEREGILIVGR